jgi:hypothetical protein
MGGGSGRPGGRSTRRRHRVVRGTRRSASTRQPGPGPTSGGRRRVCQRWPVPVRRRGDVEIGLGKPLGNLGERRARNRDLHVAVVTGLPAPEEVEPSLPRRTKAPKGRPAAPRAPTDATAPMHGRPAPRLDATTPDRTKPSRAVRVVTSPARHLGSCWRRAPAAATSRFALLKLSP